MYINMYIFTYNALIVNTNDQKEKGTVLDYSDFCFTFWIDL